MSILNHFHNDLKDSSHTVYWLEVSLIQNTQLFVFIQLIHAHMSSDSLDKPLNLLGSSTLDLSRNIVMGSLSIINLTNEVQEKRDEHWLLMSNMVVKQEFYVCPSRS